MQPSMTRRLASGLVGAALIAAACGGGPSTAPSAAQATAATSPGAAGPAPKLEWPAPADPLALTVEAGLQPETQEYATYHVHSHLDVFIDGVPVIVPAGIGINTEDPDVGAFPEADGSTSYGDISVCAVACISPLHTHFQSGIIHIEAQRTLTANLGQLFTEWAVELSPTCVGEYCSPAKPIAVYLNGDAFTGDPSEILLADLLEIAIVIGTPPAQIPSTADFARP